MFNLKDKKTKICLVGIFISLAVLLIVFFATDDLLGEKEFSEYSRYDWSIAFLPLSIIIISGISTLTFTSIVLIPLLVIYPALVDYVTNKKFSNIDSATDFLVFDHNEFKRACCHIENQCGLWISVMEYNLKAKEWRIIENYRHIENASTLEDVLTKDYRYDKIKYYDIYGHFCGNEHSLWR